MSSNYLASASVLALASVLIAPNQSLAQDSQPATPSWAVQEVVVTARHTTYSTPVAASATRTDTPLIQVPQSVQVINRTLITEQDARTLTDALANVSGVIPTQPQEDLFIGPIVRGFSAEVYVDGLPLFGGNQQAADPTSLVGVDRIEVLKGPTATLYGGGLGTPLGGLINLESERPYGQFGGFVAVRGGSFSTWNPYGDVNVPLAKGVAARVSAEYQNNGSWIDQVKGSRWSVQPSLSFQLGPKTELFVQGRFNHQDELEYSGLPASQALAGQLDRNAFPGAPIGQPHTANDSQMGTIILRHDFSDRLRLTVSGRYYNDSIAEFGSFIYPAFYPPDPATPTVYPIVPLDMATTTREGTFDANLLAKADILGGQHQLLVGVDYDHTDFSSIMAFVANTVGAIDLAHPAYNLAYGSPYPLGVQYPFDLAQIDNYQTLSVYAQDQATYGRLHLTGALRYTRLRFVETQLVTANDTYNHISPRIGATVDIAPGVAVYAGYATAFRAAFEFVGLAAPKPETSSNIEAGLKVALKRAGLTGTVSIFQQTRDNVATPDPSNPFLSVQTGQQRARGLEADFIWEPTPALSLLANYAYTNTQVTKDNSIPIGEALARVPRDSGRVAARYRVLSGPAKGLSFGLGVTAVGARQDTLPATVSVPGNVLVDAQVSYDFRRYTIAISAVNLNGSSAYEPYEYLGFPVVMPTQPRSAYVTLKVRF
jgi:iron complex outermembrane recepter protein